MEAESGGFSAEPVQAKRGRILRNENGSQPKVVRRRFQGARHAIYHRALFAFDTWHLWSEIGISAV